MSKICRARFWLMMMGLALGSGGLALGPLWAAEYAAAKHPEVNTKEKVMTVEQITHMPFGLDKASDLGKIEIKLAFHGAKTGAGRQEMTLWGDGRVRLFFSRSDQDKSPKILEGTCEFRRILSLLDFMEGNGVMDGPEHVGEKPGGSARELEIILPGRKKRIFLQDTGDYSVEQVIGAVMLAAGQCLPEALNHRLFPNL